MLSEHLMIFFSLLIALYSSFIRPDLSPFIKNLFNNNLFRIIILLFIAYKANTEPRLAIVIAIAFMSTINMLVQEEMKESFLQLEHFHEIEHFYNDEKENIITNDDENTQSSN